jgi:hypothetical protein
MFPVPCTLTGTYLLDNLTTGQSDSLMAKGGLELLAAIQLHLLHRNYKAFQCTVDDLTTLPHLMANLKARYDRSAVTFCNDSSIWYTRPADLTPVRSTSWKEQGENLPDGVGALQHGSATRLNDGDVEHGPGSDHRRPTRVQGSDARPSNRCK